MLGITYWYTRARRVLRFSCGIVTKPYVPASRKSCMIQEARWHLVGYALIATISVISRSKLALDVRGTLLVVNERQDLRSGPEKRTATNHKAVLD
jgi:hypothetical protein